MHRHLVSSLGESVGAVSTAVNPDELFPKKNGSGSRPSGQSAMMKAPFPLAIVTPGFLVGSESYDFIAGGYVRSGTSF